MRTIEATPIYDRECPPHKRRRGKRLQKPFKIEARYIGKRVRWYGNLGDLFNPNWHIVGGYETERGRDSALKAKSHGNWKRSFEYRAAETSA